MKNGEYGTMEYLRVEMEPDKYSIKRIYEMEFNH